MPLRANMEPKDFLEILSRKKWLVIFQVLLIMFAASVYCVLKPNVYESSTTILIIPQRVPEKFVSSTTPYGIEERLSATAEQILSRTRLIEVIDRLGLYREERNTVPAQVLADQMRKRIGIDILHGKDAFVLSFEHEDPKVAMQTVTDLSSLFIEENLRIREQMSIGTSEFLDTQLKEVKQKLEAQEEKVKQYKLKYMGELPQEMQANLSRLGRLQEQRRTNAEAIAKGEDRKLFMESQVSNLQNQIRTLEGGSVNPTDQLFDELHNKRKQLEELTAKYTPNYPTVIQLRNEIELLERRITSSEAKGSTTDNTGSTGLLFRKKAVQEREEVGRLHGQIKSLELDILALKREQVEIQRESDSIQARVARLPQREQEMVALTRDYNNLKESYDDLLKKKLEAKVSQNLEERRKGEQFQILDPPDLPAVPVKPNRKKILGLSFIAALGLSLGGALGLELLDPRLRGTGEFKYFFELPILATIPIIQDAQYTRRNMLKRAALIGGFLSFVCVVIAFVFLYGDRIKTIIQF